MYLIITLHAQLNLYMILDFVNQNVCRQAYYIHSFTNTFMHVYIQKKDSYIIIYIYIYIYICTIILKHFVMQRQMCTFVHSDIELYF